MTWHGVLWAAALAGTMLRAEIGAPGPPGELAAEVRAALADSPQTVAVAPGVGIEAWPLRRGAPLPGAPARGNGMRVNYGFLTPGQLVAALRVLGSWRDARGQAIPAGVYTLHYAVQPLRKDHVGVSPYRDFLVLVPGAASALEMTEDDLIGASRTAAGGSHPLVLALIPGAGANAVPATGVLRLAASDGREIDVSLPPGGSARSSP